MIQRSTRFGGHLLRSFRDASSSSKVNHFTYQSLIHILFSLYIYISKSSQKLILSSFSLSLYYMGDLVLILVLILKMI